jgi:hypothetical protein
LQSLVPREQNSPVAHAVKCGANADRTDPRF